MFLIDRFGTNINLGPSEVTTRQRSLSGRARAGALAKLVEVAAVFPVRRQRTGAVHHRASFSRIYIFQIHKQLIVFWLLKIQTTKDVKREYDVAFPSTVSLIWGKQVHGVYRGLVLKRGWVERQRWPLRNWWDAESSRNTCPSAQTVPSTASTSFHVVTP